MAAKKNPVPELHRFEDTDVLRSTIAVAKAGDGLSAALSVEPAEYHDGETVYVVLQTTVTQIAYKGIKDMDALERKHTLTTVHGSVVEGQAVAALLAETVRLLAIKKEEDAAAKGIVTLPGTGVADVDDETSE